MAGGIREKTEKEYIDADWKKISANAKTLNILHCALNVIEYNHVSCYESAKEVWDKLEVTYKGTNQVKKSKVNLLIRDFEMFEIKPSETIVEMCTRFTDLMNLLKALNFTRYTHNELIRLLIVNEMMFKKEITEKEKGKKGIALKLEKLTDGKNKYIALKIDISESSNLSSDEEIAMLAKKT
uniref:UBN2 domain-containing protein n=1 Tax=Manihot esculenta TaxID=3983 RepID=A0A2C9UAP2_MANES